MEGFDAWITGRKGFQSTTRATLPLFEAEGERVKVNPLVGWSATDVLDYIREAGLPRHPLVAKGFPSIGCMPCTSAVRPGEDERAGPLARPRQDRMRHPHHGSRRGSGHLMALWRLAALPKIAGRVSPTTRRRPPTGAVDRVAQALARANARRSTARQGPVGVAVEAGADAQAHLADLAGRPLVALAFAKFARRAGLLLRPAAARPLRLQGRIARDRRRADRRNPADAPLRLRCVRGRRTRRRCARSRPAACRDRRSTTSPASVAGETPAGARPWLRASAG